MTSHLLDRALVEEATKKSGLVWVTAPGLPARARWHVWHDGAACVVGDGPGEQPLAGLVDGASAEVTVRSKDKGGRLVSWAARVTELPAGSKAWQETVAQLKGKRLNAPDGEEQPARWARESRVLRLEPTGRVLEQPGHLPTRSHAAEPPSSPATTRGPLPFGLGRRARRR